MFIVEKIQMISKNVKNAYAKPLLKQMQINSTI